MRNPIFALALAAFAAFTAIDTIHAQDWPNRPVKIVVGLAAGGATDSVARIIGQPLSDRLGQPFVIENRVGAGGALAAESVARSPADGYTLLMANPSQMAIGPAISPQRYDAVKDFAPVTMVGSNPFVLCINANMPVKTYAEFVAHVKKQPGALSYGSGGVGNTTHLSMAYFLKLAGLDMIHVPYRGGAPAMADLVSGHIAAMFASLPDALPFAQSGQVRLLAVSSGARLSKLPDVPTVIELGIPQYKMLTWHGLVAPAGTPPQIVDRLAQEITLALKDPANLARLGSLGIDPSGAGPKDLAETIKADIELWGDAVNMAGAKAQ